MDEGRHGASRSGSAVSRRSARPAASRGRSTPRSATCRSSARTAIPTRAGTPRTLPFPDPAQLFVVPDHYVFRMLCSQGVPLDRSRRAARRRRPDRDRRPPHLAPLRRELPPAPRHPVAALARPYLRDGLRPRRPPVGRDRRSPLRPHRRLPRPARVPAARAVRALQHRGDRHHRERRSTTCAGTG